MGAVVSTKSQKAKSHQLIMLGLDASGKSSILNHLVGEQPCDDSHQLEVTASSDPTLGFRIGVAKLGRKCPTIVWEIGGKPHIRSTWTHYMAQKDAIVYVVDYSNLDRLKEAKRELQTILSGGEGYGLPLLLLAHKQDKEPQQTQPLEDILDLDTTARNRQWIVRETTILNKDTLVSAFTDLYDVVKERRKCRK